MQTSSISRTCNGYRHGAGAPVTASLLEHICLAGPREGVGEVSSSTIAVVITGAVAVIQAVTGRCQLYARCVVQEDVAVSTIIIGAAGVSTAVFAAGAEVERVSAARADGNVHGVAVVGAVWG